MRVNIVGTSGSGKTTFGRKLAEVLEVPFIEMDAIFWGPDWSCLEDEHFFQILSKALEGEDWVLDGGYSRTTPIKWSRAQAVVWLDFNFPRTLYQAVTRAVSRLLTKEELWPGTGNRETLAKLFSKDSIVLWTITSFARKRRKLPEVMASAEFRHIKFHRLRTPRQAEVFLREVKDHPGMLISSPAAKG
ncbi:MAG: shikimate kinase [Anaerolineales bacterium]